MTEDDLRSLIDAAEAVMEPPMLAFWQRIRISPEKWALPPWGDEGGGFWVVATVGRECVWYNDIEDGFNVSRFEAFGCIADYRCNQPDLKDCITGLFERFMIGLNSVPEPGDS
jgi:hypothetical protein